MNDKAMRNISFSCNAKGQKGVWVTNWWMGLTSIIGLSAFKTYEITYILNVWHHLLVRLITAANDVVYVQKRVIN